MCSTRGPDKESYDFFVNIEDYIKKAKNAEITTALSKAEKECNSFMKNSETYFKDKIIANRICNEFVKLYLSLTDLRDNKNDNINYIKSSEFLNYWVNFKLRKNMKNEDDYVYIAYNAIDSHIMENSFYVNDIDFICDINKDDLHKMNILYNLYDKYIELKTIVEEESNLNEQSLLNHSTACCPYYIEASYICTPGSNNNNSTKFCKELETFKSKYGELYRTVVEKKGSEFSENFITLTKCPNNKIISTAVTGTVVGLIPLLGVLYKFTPMGQMFRSKIGILNKDISNNVEDMTNMSLMQQENESVKFNQGTYNIKYQSL
ncbi:PIR protein [Plasmodium vivax]|uniref:VIR protein n=1 Tax=Plasmodium vivax TaxID=5855 RepID=A0A565A5S3_PLAVI|nr:PIR protein [Plasmodium vivax]